MLTRLALSHVLHAISDHKLFVLLADVPPSPLLVSWADKSFTLSWPSPETDEWTRRMPEGNSEIQCREDGEEEWRSVVRLVDYHQRNYRVVDVKVGTQYFCRVKLFRYGKRLSSLPVSVKTHSSMIGLIMILSANI